MMLRTVFIAFILLGSIASQGQQTPLHSHYVLNYFQLNPAVAGSKPCLDMKVSYRRQWSGIPEGPRTATGNIHGNFGNGKYNFHGIGARVHTDNTGPIGFTGLNVAYAYHMKTTRKYYLSVGASVGFQQFRVSVGDIILPDVQFLQDDAFLGGSSEFLFPMIDFGLWYYKDDRFYGFAITNMLEQNYSIIGLNSAARRHYSLAAGRAIDMEDGFMFKPAAHIQFIPGSRVSFELTGMIDYKSKIEIGAGFRSESGVTALARFDLFKYITLGYAYDFALSRIRFDGRHTHEVVLGIQACAGSESRAVPCAAYQ